MKLALYSDLHQEIPVGRWDPPAAALLADVIVLAGDIASRTHGLTWAAERFPKRPIIYVAGNHEFYDHTLTVLAELQHQRWADMGIHFLENQAVEIGGVRFLGCTLWSGFDLYGDSVQQALAMQAARQGINDYWMIRTANGRVLEPQETLARHQESVAWLDRELGKPFDGKTVVITHFAPHRGCVAPEHEGSDVSPYFVTDLAWLMAKHPIAVWCHGHTHTNNDFVADNGCRVLSNQLGYPGERTRVEYGVRIDTGFRDDLLIEV